MSRLRTYSPMHFEENLNLNHLLTLGIESKMQKIIILKQINLGIEPKMQKLPNVFIICKGLKHKNAEVF